MRTACVCASARVPCRTSVRAFAPFTSFVAGRQAGRQATIHPFFLLFFGSVRGARKELSTPSIPVPDEFEAAAACWLRPTVLHRPCYFFFKKKEDCRTIRSEYRIRMSPASACVPNRQQATGQKADHRGRVQCRRVRGRGPAVQRRPCVIDAVVWRAEAAFGVLG